MKIDNAAKKFIADNYIKIPEKLAERIWFVLFTDVDYSDKWDYGERVKMAIQEVNYFSSVGSDQTWSDHEPPWDLIPIYEFFGYAIGRTKIYKSKYIVG